MKTRFVKLLICGLIVAFLVSLSGTVAAQPSLQWYTESVYYDSQGRLIIDGYFYNNGTRTVTWVNWIEVKVYFRQYNTNWWEQAAATFTDLNVYLEPGQRIGWKLRIHNVDYSQFDYWNVRWNLNYRYQ